MKKRLIQLTGIFAMCFLGMFTLDLFSPSGEEGLLLSKVIPNGYSQTMCSPPALMCGPLMGNSSGSRYCCANTDSSCCYASGCGGGPNT